MNNNLKGHYEELKQAVMNAYESGTTMEEAERLAAKCLGAQLDIATEIGVADLDARMKKNGLKATKAQAYMEEISKHDKKPSDSFLENVVTLNSLVNTQADLYEHADANREELNLFFGIFKDAHIYFRMLVKANN